MAVKMKPIAVSNNSGQLSRALHYSTVNESKVFVMEVINEEDQTEKQRFRLYKSMYGGDESACLCLRNRIDWDKMSDRNTVPAILLQ